jgi:hypothetical protein
MRGEAEWGRLDDCLQKAATETFEMMCFSAAEPVSGEGIGTKEMTGTQILFDGDAAGVLCLAIESGTARLLAANFYGQDPLSLHGSQVEAVIAELTNVVCGGMLSLFAPDGSFSLSAPELHRPCSPPPGSLERGFRVESGRVVISVTSK